MYIYMLIIAVISLILISLPILLNKFIYVNNKNEAYECGFQNFSLIDLPHEVSCYKTALIFLLFDIEIIFLIPFATILFDVNYIYVNKISGFVFFLLLWIGFIIEYNNDMFKWK